mmetsp:Transcript_7875/g.19552  ORF Transcript_7875/g.19552 Transcript_7875/m.19552 type:complete len:355 (+) Transcript_7875:440-1504(+)
MADEKSPLLGFVSEPERVKPEGTKPEGTMPGFNNVDSVPDTSDPTTAPVPPSHDPELGDIEAEEADSKEGMIISSANSTNSTNTTKSTPIPGVHLTFKNAYMLETEIYKNKLMHILAFEHFATMQFYHFTLPQASFTAIASVLAFSASSSLMKEYASEISLTVGCLSALVVLLQTIAGVRQYGLRADRHNTAAIQLRDLHDDMVMTKLKLKELEDMGDDAKDPDPVTFATIQKRYRQCLSSCSSVLPVRIQEAFHGLETNIHLQETKENLAIIENIYPNTNHTTMLKSKAFDIMAGEIVNSSMYPHKLPNSKIMVKVTMHKLRQRIRTNKFFYSNIDSVAKEKYDHQDKDGMFC